MGNIMKRKMLSAKIHRATVTQANLDYEGSITIAADLMKEANFLPGEAVCIWDVTNGNRLETYTLEGPAGSSDICINGAAAHLIQAGDIVIIASFAYLDDAECETFKPTVVFVDQNNKVKDLRQESPASSNQHLCKTSSTARKVCF